MPELGTTSREQVASLVGLAPFDDDSASRRGRRFATSAYSGPKRDSGKGRRPLAGSDAPLTRPEMSQLKDALMARMTLGRFSIRSKKAFSLTGRSMLKALAQDVT